MIKYVLMASLIYLGSFIVTFLVVSSASYYLEGIAISTTPNYQEKIYLFIGIITGMITITLINLYKMKTEKE